MVLSTTSTRRKLVASANSPNSDKASVVSSTRHTIKSKTPGGLKSERNDYLPNKKKSLIKSAPSSSANSPKKAKILKTAKPFNSTNGTTPVIITNYQRRKLLQEANNALALGSTDKSSNSSLYNDANNNMSSSFMFCEQNYTRENYAKQEEAFTGKCSELRERLSKLRELGVISDAQSAKLMLSKMRFESEAAFGFINEYVNELRRVEVESNESLAVVKLWYDKQKREIEQIFQNENRRATIEYQDKRADLKENLRNEYEDMRKQVDIDRTTLDINNDTTEVKPPPTRNLRRRVNQLNPYDFETSVLDLSANVGIGSASSGASLLLQSSEVVSSSIVSSVVSGGTTLCSTSFAQFTAGGVGGIPSYFASVVTGAGLPYYGATSSSASNLIASVNDRKRKLTTATIAFGLNEDELNEDFKFLVKGSSVSKKELQLGCNSSPKIHTSTE